MSTENNEIKKKV